MTISSIIIFQLFFFFLFKFTTTYSYFAILIQTHDGPTLLSKLLVFIFEMQHTKLKQIILTISLYREDHDISLHVFHKNNNAIYGWINTAPFTQSRVNLKLLYRSSVWLAFFLLITFSFSEQKRLKLHFFANEYQLKQECSQRFNYFLLICLYFNTFSRKALGIVW